MAKGMVLNLSYIFLSFLFAPSTQGRDKKIASHQEIILSMALSQGVSKDSGYWDYALLMFYDEMMHTVILSGVTSLTNFGWAERAALVSSGALDVKNSPTLLSYVRGLSSFFVAFSRNFFLVIVALGLFVLPDILTSVETVVGGLKAE